MILFVASTRSFYINIVSAESDSREDGYNPLPFSDALLESVSASDLHRQRPMSLCH